MKILRSVLPTLLGPIIILFTWLAGRASDILCNTLPGDTATCTIVVLGSSTAEGTGASPDSGWVKLYTNTLAQRKTKYNVVNLARGGYTTWQLLPDGTDGRGNSGFPIDPERNMTKALSYHPSAIVINLPSNDAANGFGADIQMKNFDILYKAGEKGGAQVYIASTQPRNFDDPAQIRIQEIVRDSILTKYGDHAIDFWTGIATQESRINEKYNSGDGIHLNNTGHRILYKRILAIGLDKIPCSHSATK